MVAFETCPAPACIYTFEQALDNSAAIAPAIYVVSHEDDLGVATAIRLDQRQRTLELFELSVYVTDAVNRVMGRRTQATSNSRRLTWPNMPVVSSAVITSG